MTGWTVGQLLEVTGGQLLVGSPAAPVSSFSIDSRRLRPQQAFLAIRGLRFDGHAFVREAVDRGAGCILASEVPSPLPPVPAIVVPDTVRALGELAAFHRSRFAGPVIAVTGSCGKTTTKELIAHLLDPDLRVLKTTGTQNNHIGLPLTLLSRGPSHECLVVELGSNHPGEIAYLAQIAKPTVAVITNVGPAHLEFFKTLDGVLQEKLSLLDGLAPQGVAVVPGDQLDVLLAAKARRKPGTSLLTFGTSDQCGVQAVDIRRDAQGWSLALRDVPGRFALPLPGLHNLENALAALACVKALGTPLADAAGRLAGFAGLPLRSQVVRCNGFTIVNDCYNANPLSFARALEVLKDLPVSRRIVIAGDMLELGEMAQAAHRSIGRLAAQLGMDVVIGVGEFATDIAQGASELTHARGLACRTVDEVLPLLETLLQGGDGVLVKGSRKMQLERVTEWLMQHS